MLNNVVLIGRLTHDPEVRYTANEGTPVTDFSIAVKRFGSDDADFIGITAWKKQAENVCQYLGKGSMVAVEGSIRVDKYTDKEGVGRKSTKVVARSVTFLDSKGKAERDDSGYASNIEDDDVPF